MSAGLLRSQEVSVNALVRPWGFSYDLYSAYYRHGLRQYLSSVDGTYTETPLGRHAKVLRVMRRVRDMYRLRPLFRRAPLLGPAIDHAGRHLEGEFSFPNGQPSAAEQFTHFYELTTPDGRSARFAIDPADDGGQIIEPTVGWCDVYFKTNYWTAKTYPGKVVPLVNGDPLIIPQLPRLRAQRRARKQYDLCMVLRVWGGKDEVEGVEHNLRLIEAVARARGSKFLYAYLVAGDISAAARRLERQGIPCGTQPVPAAKLWEVTAASRLNVIRLGMHHCVPWRMTGALAIGSAVVLDRAPLSRWPEPMVEGTHFLALGAETGVNQPLAMDEAYSAIPGKIDAWLADQGLAERIADTSASYFDRFVAPERVGEHIVRATRAALA
jgi:hypothetical protein